MSVGVLLVPTSLGNHPAFFEFWWWQEGNIVPHDGFCMIWTIRVKDIVVSEENGCDATTGAISWTGHWLQFHEKPLTFPQLSVAIDEYRDSYIDQASCRHEYDKNDPTKPGVQPSGWIILRQYPGVLIKANCYLDAVGFGFAHNNGLFSDCNWMPRWAHDVALPSIPDPHSALAPLIPGGDYSNPSNDPIAQGPMKDAESFGDMIQTALSLGTLGIEGRPDPGNGYVLGWCTGDTWQ